MRRLRNPAGQTMALGQPGYSSTPWTVTQDASSLTWSSETFAQNQNANAIRLGTLYNFRFDADHPPQSANATVGFFKTGSPMTVAIQAPAGSGTPTPTPTASPTPTPTATATATATATDAYCYCYSQQQRQLPRQQRQLLPLQRLQLLLQRLLRLRQRTPTATATPTPTSTPRPSPTPRSVRHQGLVLLRRPDPDVQ